jgi:hypothetical protein
MFTDRAGEHVQCRCPNIGGYVPDVYGIGIRPPDARLVGEAKSSVDFRSPRTEFQLQAFLNHLAAFPVATLLLAVPFGTLPSASSLMLRMDAHEASHVRIVIVAPHVTRVINRGWLS